MSNDFALPPQSPASDSLDSSTLAGSENDFPEICYITDDAGIIVSLDDSHWNSFINVNFPQPLTREITRCCFPEIVGRNLFEFIGDVKVQGFYRHMVYMLITDMQKKFVYHWFCDSPQVERKMSMTVTKLSDTSACKWILWRSQILSQKILSPPQSYLAAPTVPGDAEEKAPKRTVCSYCKRILVTCKEMAQPEELFKVITQLKGNYIDQEYVKIGKVVPIVGLRGKMGQQYSSTGKLTHLWLTATQYYGAFFSDDIVINHGVCELCYEEVAMLFMPVGSFKDGKKCLVDSEDMKEAAKPLLKNAPGKRKRSKPVHQQASPQPST